MKPIYILIAFILIPLSQLAQETGSSPKGQKDFQLWIDGTINYKVNKKLDLQFEAAHRRENNLADNNETYLELQVRSDPFDFLVLSGGYRFSGWLEDITVHRLFVFARFEANLDRFRFQYRTRYDNNFGAKQKALPEHWRNKIKIRYRTRKFPIDPFVAYELFYRLNEWDRRLSQQRFDIGLQYSISKKQGLKAYYRYQQRLNARSPNQNFILGISYSFDL